MARDNPATLRALAQYLDDDAEHTRLTPFMGLTIPLPDA